MTIAPLQLSEIRGAAAAIASEAVVTRALSDPAIDRLAGARVSVKAECEQRSGSFKFRGAFHRLLQIEEADRRNGVVAVSSGNHGAAVACAAQILGMAATIHIPHDTAPAKRALIEGFGAQVVTFDRAVADREAVPRAEAARTGATLVHPFEDRAVMLGQGTTALELLDQVDDLDVLLVPMSGGGLMAGCGSAVRALSPNCELIGVEPTLAADTAASMRQGERVRVTPGPTIADGLALAIPGKNTFGLNRDLVDDVVTVSDEAMVDAMRVLHQHLGLVVEPSGAVGLAALVHHPGRWTDKRVGVIVSGGNIDAERFAALTGT